MCTKSNLTMDIGKLTNKGPFHATIEVLIEKDWDIYSHPGVQEDTHKDSTNFRHKHVPNDAVVEMRERTLRL